MNLTYVRDFDCLQVNATPIVLGTLALLSCSSEASFTMVGMAVSLLADAYFALRYAEDTDEIKFTIVEKFARESWTN